MTNSYSIIQYPEAYEFAISSDDFNAATFKILMA
jgi:hypothetical protein